MHMFKTLGSNLPNCFSMMIVTIRDFVGPILLSFINIHKLVHKSINPCYSQ